MTQALPTVGRGRPLRFLGAVAVGWVSMRVVFWPTVGSLPTARSPPVVVHGASAVPSSSALSAAVGSQRALPELPERGEEGSRGGYRVPPAIRHAASAPHRSWMEPDRVVPATPALTRFAPPAAPVGAPPLPFQPGVPTSARLAPSVLSRWSGSAWLVARPGGNGMSRGAFASQLGGQLGGSQAGVRLAYMLDRKRRIALAGRVTTPLGTGLREAALGVEWQPTRLPIRLVADERIALGAGTGGPEVGVVGGLGPIALGAGFRVEAYAQAGVIHREQSEPYADGAARVARPLASLGRARLGAGGGVWAAAQRGAMRVDLGPVLTLDLPLAHQTVRLFLEYRARVAGDARPGSGVALTLGTDF